MPRKSRENTTEEKQRMRSKRNKRKRLLRVEKQRKATEIIRQKERAAYIRARELARTYYGKWKLLAEQNQHSRQNQSTFVLTYELKRYVGFQEQLLAKRQN